MRGPKPTKNSVTFMPERLATIMWPASCSMIVRTRPMTIEIVTHADGRARTSSAMPTRMTTMPVTAFLVSTGGESSSGSFTGTSCGSSVGDGLPGALARDPVRFENV